jgi:hypothetical protein
MTADLNHADVDSLTVSEMMVVPGPLEDLPDEVESAVDETAAEEQPARRSVATLLVELAQEAYSLGVNPDGESYALPTIGGHVVTMLREGRTGLRAELAREYFAENHRAANSAALTDALAVLDGIAAQQEPVEVHLRTASHGGAVYIDMGDRDNHVIRVDVDGWSIITTDVPVRFRRTKLTAGFPNPERGGDLDEMWSLLNIAESDRVLVLAFIVAALIQPDVPHPVLTLFAEQGAGKSSATRIIVDLIDPSPVPLRRAPRDGDQWTVAASGSWVVALDNLSDVPDWLSDALCRACTGDGDVKRALYTDAGLSVVKFRRCIIANGIDVGAHRGDLAERLLSVSMHPITGPNRRREEDLNIRWNAMYPKVFGALLDLCARVLATLPNVELDSSPRMADFALLLAAIDRVLSTDGLGRYLGRAGTIAEDTLSADVFIAYLREELTQNFEGTSAELLSSLSRVLPAGPGSPPRPRGWPRNPRQVTTLLKRHAPALRTRGWVVDEDEGRNQQGVTRWTLTPPAARDQTCEPSP